MFVSRPRRVTLLQVVHTVTNPLRPFRTTTNPPPVYTPFSFLRMLISELIAVAWSLLLTYKFISSVLLLDVAWDTRMCDIPLVCMCALICSWCILSQGDGWLVCFVVSCLCSEGNEEHSRHCVTFVMIASSEEWMRETICERSHRLACCFTSVPLRGLA